MLNELELERFCANLGHKTEEMQREIQGLKFALGQLGHKL